MAVRLLGTRTSHSFSSAVGSAKGTWEYTARVTGTATPETDLIAAVAADAPYFWYDLSRREMTAKVLDLDRGLYAVTVDYVYEVPNGAASDPTHTPPAGSGPGGGTPSGTPSGPATDETPLGPNVTLEIGGRPPRLYTSRSVVFSEKAGGGAATDRGTAINVQGGKVEGIEVDDPASTLAIDVQYDRVTMKFINLLFAAVWHTNLSDWWFVAAGCAAFTGASLRTNDSGRVSCTLKFGLRPEETILANSLRADAGKELPTADVTRAGWDYLEVYYEDVPPSGGVTYTVRKPLEAYVHEVLPPLDYSVFGIGV